MRNTICNTSLWVSFKSRMRLNSMGPISLTVVRSGCPCSPNTSQKHTGLSLYSKPQAVRLLSAMLLSKCTLPPPALATPERSPLMSVANTGTPMALKVSARFCKVQVFPVPVAPAISPWRLAIEGIMPKCFSPLTALKGVPVLSIIGLYAYYVIVLTRVGEGAYHTPSSPSLIPITFLCPFYCPRQQKPPWQAAAKVNLSHLSTGATHVSCPSYTLTVQNNCGARVI